MFLCTFLGTLLGAVTGLEVYNGTNNSGLACASSMAIFAIGMLVGRVVVAIEDLRRQIKG